jgi:hypothetical protein
MATSVALRRGAKPEEGRHAGNAPRTRARRPDSRDASGASPHTLEVGRDGRGAEAEPRGELRDRALASGLGVQ